MAILNSGFFVFQSYYIIFLTVNGLSYTDISLIFVGNFVALAILNLFAGDYADRHGRKKAILIGGAINVFGFLVYGLSSSILLFLLAAPSAQLAAAGRYSCSAADSPSSPLGGFSQHTCFGETGELRLAASATCTTTRTATGRGRTSRTPTRCFARLSTVTH